MITPINSVEIKGKRLLSEKKTSFFLTLPVECGTNETLILWMDSNDTLFFTLTQPSPYRGPIARVGSGRKTTTNLKKPAYRGLFCFNAA